MPPFATPQQGAPGPNWQQLFQNIAQIEKNVATLINEHNKWVAKIQGIDSVAWAALYLHDDKEFVLDEESVNRNGEKIQGVLTEMTRWRDEAKAKAEAEAAAPAQLPVADIPPTDKGEVNEGQPVSDNQKG